MNTKHSHIYGLTIVDALGDIFLLKLVLYNKKHQFVILLSN